MVLRIPVKPACEAQLTIFTAFHVTEVDFVAQFEAVTQIVFTTITSANA